jgi:hypothetical protein
VTQPIRSLLVAGSLVAAAVLAACGSSGGDASPSTTAATTTSPTTSTTADGTTTTAGTDATTTEASGAGATVDCQALLEEYAEVFDPDDLSGTVAFFRQYEPDMPDDVAAATERLAVAYEEAGDLGNLALGDVDLTADAQTFSDWTNDGCPAG